MERVIPVHFSLQPPVEAGKDIRLFPSMFRLLQRRGMLPFKTKAAFGGILQSVNFSVFLFC